MTMEDLNWVPVYPPSRQQEKTLYKGLCLMAHDAGSWWVYVERNGACLYLVEDAHTGGGCGANKDEAKMKALNAADAYLSKYPHL